MKISNFEHTGLNKVEKWLQEKNIQDLNKEIIIEILKTINVSFSLEDINRIQSTLLCELKDSYVQQSQRYVTMGEAFYTLPSLDTVDSKKAKYLLDNLFETYKEMSELNEGKFKGRPKLENYKHKIPIEDARYILPLATKTNVYCAMTADKLFDLYNLIMDKRYRYIFSDIKSEIDKYIPDTLKNIFLNLPTSNAKCDNLVQDFYQDYLDKITFEQPVVLLETFDDLDMKVGLGALTSTQFRTPSDTLKIWEDEAVNKAKGVAKRVLSYGHDSIAEQARTTFGMLCSMVTYHQQIRHRLSNNYREPFITLINEKDRTPIVPPSIKNSEFYEKYLQLINEIKNFRVFILQKYGLDKALYFLLNADATKLVISTNARMDISMLSERICLNSQWEIRELSTKKLIILRKLSEILYEKALPSCIFGTCKEGKLSCGKQAEIRKKLS